jgi:hypothetical protein
MARAVFLFTLSFSLSYLVFTLYRLLRSAILSVSYCMVGVICWIRGVWNKVGVNHLIYNPSISVQSIHFKASIASRPLRALHVPMEEFLIQESQSQTFSSACQGSTPDKAESNRLSPD